MTKIDAQSLLVSDLKNCKGDVLRDNRTTEISGNQAPQWWLTFRVSFTMFTDVHKYWRLMNPIYHVKS